MEELTLEELKEEYNKVLSDKKETEGELNKLAKDPKVRKYLGLSTKKNRLISKENELSEKILTNEFDNCKHVFITSKVEHDYSEERTYCSKGCIKCGLDDSLLSEDNYYLTKKEEIMANYLRSNYYKFFGKYLDVICDTRLAQAIYKRILETHPNIDEDIAIKYFEIALDNIRSISVNEDRKKSRAKRLSLGSNFDKWNIKDVSD